MVGPLALNDQQEVVGDDAVVLEITQSIRKEHDHDADTADENSKIYHPCVHSYTALICLPETSTGILGSQQPFDGTTDSTFLKLETVSGKYQASGLNLQILASFENWDGDRSREDGLLLSFIPDR